MFLDFSRTFHTIHIAKLEILANRTVRWVKSGWTIRMKDPTGSL